MHKPEDKWSLGHRALEAGGGFEAPGTVEESVVSTQNP